MKRIAFGNRLTPFLLATCLLLGIVVAAEWYALFRQDEPAAAGDSELPAVTTDDVELARSTYAAPDFSAFSEILERPLFSEGRSPPEQPAAEQTVVSPGMQTQLALRLEGIALTPVARIAVVRDITNNTLLRLAEGAKHQGWVVESVQATSATLKRGEQIHELTLELDQNNAMRPPIRVKKKRR